MIKVQVKKKKDKINEIIVSGHANHGKHGQDIVCASVSSMVMIAINIIINEDPYALIYNDEAGFMKVEYLYYAEHTHNVLLVLIHMLKELEEQYPANIKIESEE